VFEQRGSRTILSHSFAEPPLRVGRCLEEGDGVHLILAMAAPGVFGGDCLETMVRIGPGAQVRLTSQSAMQVHPGADPAAARIQAHYVVGEGARLQCRWHPLIPFARARLDQTLGIELAGDAQLSWSDAFVAGRVARGERWMFDELSHELRIVRDGVLEYVERYVVNPASHDPTHAWVAASAPCFGTTLQSGRPIDRENAERLHQALANLPGLRASADTLGDRFLLARLMAEWLVPFHEGRTVSESFCF
jgi:urease accessory protein UreH